MKNCPGCNPQTIEAQTVSSSESHDLLDETESSLGELQEAIAKVKDLSSTAFGLSIIIGLVGAVLGIVAFISFSPGENEESNGAIGLIAGAIIFGVFLIQAVVMALLARYTQMLAIQAELEDH
jgi:hypothetical protein